LIAGYSYTGWSPATREGKAGIFVVSRSQSERVFSGPGFVESVDVRGRAGWAVRSEFVDHGGKEYFSVRTTDGGRTWAERGPVPLAEELGRIQILAVSEDSAYVLGTGTMLHTRDGGRTWASAKAPGQRDPHVERLALIAGRVLLLGDGMMSSDGEEHWVHRDYDGARVHAVFDDLVLATVQGRPKLGTYRPATDMIEWSPPFPKWSRPSEETSFEPIRLWARPPAIAFLAIERASGIGHTGVFFYETRDGGASWVRSEVSSCHPEVSIDLGPDGSGFSIDCEDRVLAPEP
jgi:hypothetical protein